MSEAVLLPRHRRRIIHVLRVLGVTASAEFKLKYAGSLLGYVWSVLKPLLLFTMLYLVFGRIFRLNSISPFYATSLLLGIVLYSFFSDATSVAMYSLSMRESLLRKLVFPRLVIPISATLTAAMTFLINVVVIAGFVAWEGIAPRLSWLLLLPLLIELYVFVLGVALILSVLFVRLRDMGQVWELALTLFFYASPIIYPIGYLPGWARELSFLSPFTQILQDIRSLVLYPDLESNKITAVDALGAYGRLLPIAIAVAFLVAGVLFFRREEPWLAERL